MTDKDFDKRIGDALRGYEEEPPRELFQRIEETLAAAGAAEREQQRQQQGCHARILFHAGDTSLQGALIQYNEFFPPRQPEFPAFLRALDSGVHAQYAGGGGNDRKFYQYLYSGDII